MKNRGEERKEYNKKLISLLNDLIEKNPELRFGQICNIIDIYNSSCDIFYEEPKVTYERVLNNYKAYFQNNIRENTKEIKEERINQIEKKIELLEDKITHIYSILL